MIKVNTITQKDLQMIENIGKETLPIYYKIMDLYYLLLNKDYLCLKAIKNKKIVGFIVSKTFHKDNRNHIMSIAVLNKFRRQGVGKKLIDSLKILSKNKCISLYTQKINKIAINFYEKHRFKIMNEISDYYESLEDTEAVYLEFNSNKT